MAFFIIMTVFIFMFLHFTSKNRSQGGVNVGIRTSELLAQQEARRQEHELKYARHPGSPAVHKAAIKRFLSVFILLILVFSITTLFTKDIIALSLMFFGLTGAGWFIFYNFNRKAQARFNELEHEEAYVKETISNLDDFTIPEEWQHKYL